MKKKIFLGLVITYSLVFSGCFKEDFSRYPSMLIPQFLETDYFYLLSNKNPEIVYNAIVILGGQAEEIGERLSDEKIDRNSSEYILGLKTYKKIVELLNSHDARVVAASLRFLQLFSNKYKVKDQLVGPVLKIKSGNHLVQYEQVVTLSIITNKDSNIPDFILRRFLNNSSWIISHSAYFLVNSLEHDQLRKELINKYRVMRNEMEKLLILTALEKKFNDEIADFLFTEILSTTSNKIRNAIFDILENSQNQEKVLVWLDRNYDKVIAADGKYLFEQHVTGMDEKFSSRLLSIFLNRGFITDATFLKELNKRLEYYEIKGDLSESDKEKLNNLFEVEKALLTNKLLVEQWKILRDKTKALNSELTQLQNEYDVITKEYVTKIDDIFKKYNISDIKKQKYIKGILNSRENLRDLLVNDKSTTTKEDRHN